VVVVISCFFVRCLRVVFTRSAVMVSVASSRGSSCRRWRFMMVIGGRVRGSGGIGDGGGGAIGG
jgi:hypothetical protein